MEAMAAARRRTRAARPSLHAGGRAALRERRHVPPPSILCSRRAGAGCARRAGLGRGGVASRAAPAPSSASRLPFAALPLHGARPRRAAPARGLAPSARASAASPPRPRGRGLELGPPRCGRRRAGGSALPLLPRPHPLSLASPAPFVPLRPGEQGQRPRTRLPPLAPAAVARRAGAGHGGRGCGLGSLRSSGLRPGGLRPACGSGGALRLRAREDGRATAGGGAHATSPRCGRPLPRWLWRAGAPSATIARGLESPAVAHFCAKTNCKRIARGLESPTAESLTLAMRREHGKFHQNILPNHLLFF